MPENPRIEELRRRVHADPASIAFAGLAEEFRRVGRYDEAIETCRVGLQRHPAYLSARVTLGRALIETGDFEGAREELETVLRSAPENLAAIRGLAQIHERLGHSTEMDPHLAALAHDIPASAPPVPPPVLPPVARLVAPPPASTERAAAPSFDLDLNANFGSPRASERVSQFPADDAPAAPARASVPESHRFGNEFSSSPGAFDSGASEPVVLEPVAPAHDVFDMAASEPLVVDSAAPAQDVFEMAAPEPVMMDAAAPSDVLDIVAAEPAVLDTAAPSDVLNMAASEHAAVDTAPLASRLVVDADIPELAEPAADVPLTIGVPITAAEPSTTRGRDVDLGLTFTLPGALAPQRDGPTDFFFADPAVEALDVQTSVSTPELQQSYEAKPVAEEISDADSLESDALVLGEHEPRSDPNRAATLQRLEGFLAAIQGSRVQGSEPMNP